MVRLLREQHTLLRHLVQAAVASGGGKPPNLPPYPRPRTALDRVRRRKLWAQHRYLKSKLLPHQHQNE